MKSNQLKYIEVVAIAAKTYRQRQMLFERPAGKPIFNAVIGAIRGHNSELRDCCKKIRGHSKRYPYAMWKHWKSAMHVANLYRVSRLELLRVAKTLTDADLE